MKYSVVQLNLMTFNQKFDIQCPFRCMFIFTEEKHVDHI